MALDIPLINQHEGMAVHHVVDEYGVMSNIYGQYCLSC